MSHVIAAVSTGSQISAIGILRTLELPPVPEHAHEEGGPSLALSVEEKEPDGEKRPGEAGTAERG